MLSKLGPFVQNIHNNCTFGILSARFVEDEHFVPTRWNVEDRDRPSAIPTAPWNLIRESDGRHLANLPKSTTLSRIFPSLFFFPLPPFSRTRDQCHHQHPFYSNFVHFVSLVQPLVKLLEPPSRVSCVVREYRVLDLSLHFIEFEFSSNRVEEEILLFLESKSPRRGNFSQIFILPLQISLLSIFAKNEEREIFLYLFFLSHDFFSFFCFLPRLFLPYVAFPRMSRERDSHLTTVLHRGGGTQLYGLVRVSWKDRSHPLLRLLGFGLLLLPTNFFFPFLFFFFPRKNLVRKCPSVVVKSNPDLISCTSDTFAFLSHSRRE